MADVVSPAVRSRMMSGIKGFNTKPELWIRSELHKAGFRYRLHDKRLRGKPDVVFPKYHAVMFVNGCFWHGHQCPLFKWPKTREDFWRKKITANAERDRQNQETLKQYGWRVALIWECALKGRGRKSVDTVVGDFATWLNGQKQWLEIQGNE